MSHSRCSESGLTFPTVFLSVLNVPLSSSQELLLYGLYLTCQFLPLSHPPLFISSSTVSNFCFLLKAISTPTSELLWRQHFIVVQILTLSVTSYAILRLNVCVSVVLSVKWGNKSIYLLGLRSKCLKECLAWRASSALGRNLFVPLLTTCMC